MYDKLRCLQGHIVPVLFGEIKYDGVPAFILSDVGGECMAEPKGVLLDDGGVLSETEFRTMLFDAADAVSWFGCVPDDLKLDNFIRVKDRIILIDLEQFSELEFMEDREFSVKCVVNFIVEAFRDNVDCLWHDGVLPPLPGAPQNQDVLWGPLGGYHNVHGPPSESNSLSLWRAMPNDPPSTPHTNTIHPT